MQLRWKWELDIPSKQCTFSLILILGLKRIPIFIIVKEKKKITVFKRLEYTIKCFLKDNFFWHCFNYLGTEPCWSMPVFLRCQSGSSKPSINALTFCSQIKELRVHQLPGLTSLSKILALSPFVKKPNGSLQASGWFPIVRLKLPLPIVPTIWTPEGFVTVLQTCLSLGSNFYLIFPFL